jgi:hypothetical protein
MAATRDDEHLANGGRVFQEGAEPARPHICLPGDLVNHLNRHRGDNSRATSIAPIGIGAIGMSRHGDDKSHRQEATDRVHGAFQREIFCCIPSTLQRNATFRQEIGVGRYTIWNGWIRLLSRTGAHPL